MSTTILSLPIELLERIAWLVLRKTGHKSAASYITPFDLRLRLVNTRFDIAFTQLLLRRCEIAFRDGCFTGEPAQRRLGRTGGLGMLKLLNAGSELAHTVRSLDITVQYNGSSAVSKGKQIGTSADWEGMIAAASVFGDDLAKQLLWLFAACTGLKQLRLDITGTMICRKPTDALCRVGLPSSVVDVQLVGHGDCLLYPWLRTLLDPPTILTGRLRRLRLDYCGFYTMTRRLQDGLQMAAAAKPSSEHTDLVVGTLETSMSAALCMEMLELVRMRPLKLSFRWSAYTLANFIDQRAGLKALLDMLRDGSKEGCQGLDIVYDPRRLGMLRSQLKAAMEGEGEAVNGVAEEAGVRGDCRVGYIDKRGLYINVVGS